MTEARLFFTQYEPDTCFISGERLVDRELTLSFLGKDSVAEEVLELPYAPKENIYYLEIDLLQELASDLELRLDEVQTFLIDYQEAAAFVASPEAQVPYTEMIKQSQQPQASREEAKSTPLSTETWQLAGKAGAWVQDRGDGQPGLSYIYIVTDAQGLVRASSATFEDTLMNDLPLLVYQAIVHPGYSSGLVPKRPQTLLVSDEALQEGLQHSLTELGIRVVFGATPGADEALSALGEFLGETRMPFLSDYSEGEVRAFFKAAAAFYKAKPWKRFAPRKFLGFKIGDGSWHYTNVMGQDGQEFGLAMFSDWLQVCRFMHNVPSPLEMMTGQGGLKQLKASDGAESFTLSETFAYHPEDIHYMQSLGIVPDKQGLYPAVARFAVVDDEPKLQTPRFSLPEYTVLLQAITELLGKRRSQQLSSVKLTLELQGQGIELRYPAKGDETPVRDARPYRLTIEGRKDKGHLPLDWGEDIVLEVAADSTFYDIAKLLRQTHDMYLTGFGFGDYTNTTRVDNEGEGLLAFLMQEKSGIFLWAENNDGRYGPHLRVGDVAELTPFWANIFLTYYTVKLEPLEITSLVEKIRVIKG